MKEKESPLRHGAILSKEAHEVIDEEGATLGLVRLNRDGRIGLNWVSELFNPESLAGLDSTIAGKVVRAELVAVLRKHADGLESRELDRLTKAALGFGKPPD